MEHPGEGACGVFERLSASQCGTADNVNTSSSTESEQTDLVSSHVCGIRSKLEGANAARSCLQFCIRKLSRVPSKIAILTLFCFDCIELWSSRVALTDVLSESAPDSLIQDGRDTTFDLRASPVGTNTRLIIYQLRGVGLPAKRVA